MTRSSTQSTKQSKKSTPKPATPAAAAPMATSTVVAPTLASTNGSLIFVKLPPADANTPVPPKGFIPTTGTDFRGVLPRSLEIAVLADAVSEISRFPEFSQVFGKTVPPQAFVTQVMTAAEQWSTMRNASSNWDVYCRTQEGLAWQAARTLLGSMKASFVLAANVDDTLATQNPSLVALFDAKATIAKRGAATRKANREATLAGKEPTQGKALKKAAKVAKLVAEANAKAAADAPASPPVTVVQPSPVPVASAPAASAVAANSGSSNGAITTPSAASAMVPGH
jgi:hypothetical protein